MFILSEKLKSIPVLLLIYSFCLCIIYGFDVWQHFVYNLSYLIREKQSTMSFQTLTSDIHSLKYVYRNIFAPYLTNTWLYLSLSALIKALLVMMVYFVVSKMLNRRLSILAAIIFTYSGVYVIHGAIANGIWGPAIFMPASLSALFSLLFIYFWLRGNYIFAFILAGIAVQFHALYAISVFVFIFLGGLYAIGTSANKPKAIKQNIIGMLTFFSFIGLALITDYKGFDLHVFSGIAIQYWHRFARLTDPDDMLIGYSLLDYGYGFFTLLISGTIFSMRRKNKQVFDYLAIGGMVTLVLFLIIEALHYYGIFFGKLSELFIGLQLRRGVWIAVLFGLISIVSEFVHNEKKHFDYVAATFIVAMCFPTVVTITFLILLFCALFFRADRYAVILIGAAYVVLVASAILMGNVELRREIMSLLPLAVVLMSIFAVKNLPRIASYNVVVMSITICILLHLAYSIKMDRFNESIHLLTNVDISVPQERRNFMAQLGGYDQDVIYDEPMARFLNAKEKSQKDVVIQMPLASSEYFSALYYNSLFYVDNRPVYMFSKTIFERWINKISLFWDRPVLLSFLESGKFGKTSFLKEFDKHFEAADRVVLSRAKTERGIRYYVISKMRAEISDLFVFKGDHYYVYDLEKLQ